MNGGIILEPVEVIIILMGMTIAFLWWLAIRLYRQRLAWQAIAFTLAESDWEDTEQWEIRAMAGFLYASMPEWAKGIGSDWEFENMAVAEWEKAMNWYRENEPRLNEELFGDDALLETSPF